MRGSLQERFWAKVDRQGPEECWEWTAAKLPTGYGLIGVDRHGRLGYAHRVSYQMAYGGAIPEGLYVCHRCDNPSCVNPAHLFPGTHQDNMDDRTSNGRQPRGEDHATSKLTEKQVREIRLLYATGTGSYRGLGRLYGIGPTGIRRVVNRVTWKHVL